MVLCEHIAEPHFTTLETAELLGIERRTVDYWIYTKKLPIRLVEGRNYIRLCDLEKILYEGSASIEREKNRENMIRLEVMKKQYIKKVEMIKNNMDENE